MQQSLELALSRAAAGLGMEVNHAKARKENGLGRNGPAKVGRNYVKHGSNDDA
jgi:hypothetical protein